MKTLYIDCGMGAAGDMLTSALLELLDDPQAALEELNHLGLPGIRFSAEPAEKCGIRGTYMHVTVCDGLEEEHHHHHDHDHDHHHHHHSTLADIHHLIGHLQTAPVVAERIRRVYNRIAHAESQVHGVSVEQIHFHEVGSMDALADVTAVCWLMDKLGAERIVASPVHVGSGQVHCAHGILPVPAPATELLLRGVPVYGGNIRGELCTPTGAALLREFVQEFGEMPAMTVEKAGYGCGKKDFEAANCVRCLLGESDDRADTIWELKCNLDDMTGEALGYAVEALLKAGALDVFTTPIGMKKNRPGVLLTVLCREENREALLRAMFLHTTTLGIRQSACERAVLHRREDSVQTPMGAVRTKYAEGFGVSRSKPEYEDLAKIAEKQKISLAQAENIYKESFK